MTAVTEKKQGVTNALSNAPKESVVRRVQDDRDVSIHI